MVGEAAELTVPKPGRPAWVTRVVMVVVALAITYVVVRLVGRIDWEAVGSALGQLTWWQPLVLLAVVVVRQVFNGMPLAFFIDGVSIYRSTINDLGAILMAMIAPPPSDLALRVTMFTSWGVPASKGVAGAVMNTLTFYVVRFSAPALGFLLLLVTTRPPGPRWAAIVSILISLGILVGIFLVLRSEELARSAGLTAGRHASRFRHSVDPERWAQACLTFRRDIIATFHRGFPRSLFAMVAMLAADLTVLVLCLRFVGLSSAEVGLADIAIAYLFAYPFTLFPFSGLGPVDALILAAMVESGGPEVEAAVVAGLVVWRVFTVGLPVLMGAGAVAIWRRTLPEKAAEP